MLLPPTWATSWEQDLTHSLISTFFPLLRSPLLALPLEVLRHINLSACPGSTTNHQLTFLAMQTYETLGLVCTQLRTLQANGLSEVFYKRMMMERMGLGRPKAVEKRKFAELGKGLFLDFVRYEKERKVPWQESRAGMVMEIFPDPRMLVEKAPFFFDLERGFLQVPGPQWHPLELGEVLDEAATQGQIIAQNTPCSFYDDPLISPHDMFPRCLRPPGSAEYVVEDRSVGMTLASRPGMRKMQVVVFLGLLYLGTLVVENADGVTVRDQDDALDQFFSEPLAPDKEASLRLLIPDLNFPLPTIRDLIHKVADPMPNFIPLISSGKTGVLFKPRMDEEGEEVLEVEGVDVEGLFFEFEESDEEEEEEEEEAETEGEDEQEVWEDVDEEAS